MKKETRNFIKKVIFYIIISTVLFSVLIGCILFSVNDTDYIKDSLSNAMSFLSAVSTIGAAVIAAYLFNDWREQSKFEVKRDYALDALKHIASIRKELVIISDFSSIIENSIVSKKSKILNRFKDVTILNDEEKLNLLYAPLRIIDNLENKKYLLTNEWDILIQYIYAIESRQSFIESAYEFSDSNIHTEISNTLTDHLSGLISIVDPSKIRNRLTNIKRAINENYTFNKELHGVKSLSIENVYKSAKYSELIKTTETILDNLEKELINRIKPS